MENLNVLFIQIQCVFCRSMISFARVFAAVFFETFNWLKQAEIRDAFDQLYNTERIREPCKGYGNLVSLDW